MKLRQKLGAVIAVTLVISGCNVETIKEQIQALPSFSGGDKTSSQIAGCAGAGLLTGGLLKKLDVNNKISLAGAAFACFAASELIGQEFADKLKEEEDQKKLYEAQQQAAKSGKPVTFKGKEEGVSGTVRVVKNQPRRRQQTSVQVTRELKDKVNPFPPLDYVGAPYRSNGVNMRVGPGVDYKKVTYLSPGEIVAVVGKVSGKNWYAVSKDGSTAVSGFVSSATRFMQPTTTEYKTVSAPVEADVVQQDVQVSLECKTVRQEIYTPEGPLARDVEVCQQADGSFKLS